MTEPRAGRWIARPREPLKGADWVGVAANLLWVFGLFFDRLSPWPAEPFRLWIGFAAMGLYVGIMLIAGVQRLASLRRTRRDRRLSDRGEAWDEYLVEVTLSRGSEVFGIDRGMVWFDGALLGFTGEATSFLLAATDFVEPGGVVLSDFDAPLKPLGLKSAPGGGTVTIRPLLGLGRRYRREMRAFLRAREASDAARQWPPLTTYPAQREAVGLDSARSSSPVATASNDPTGETETVCG